MLVLTGVSIHIGVISETVLFYVWDPSLLSYGIWKVGECSFYKNLKFNGNVVKMCVYIVC